MSRNKSGMQHFAPRTEAEARKLARGLLASHPDDVRAVTITLVLDADQAAALHRLADKADYQMAQSVLYPHVDPELRADQAREMMCACTQLQKAIEDAGVRGWPWIETGHAD